MSVEFHETPSKFRADNAGILEDCRVLLSHVVEEGRVGGKVPKAHRAGCFAAFFEAFEAVSFEVDDIFLDGLATRAFPLVVEPTGVFEGGEEVFRELAVDFLVGVGY